MSSTLNASATKITPNLQDNIAETLLIPLYMRAKLTQANSPILKDTSAVNLVKQIEYDFEKFNNAKMSLIGCGVRADYFDKQCLTAIVQAIGTDKNIVIINVGCGLDDRYQRVFEQSNLSPDLWQQQVHFYDMDLPEVMTLRQQLLPAHANQTYIAGSILDNEWLNTLSPVNTATTLYVILIEGVLMYFNENQVKAFFLALAEFFNLPKMPTNTLNRGDMAPILLVFDTVNSLLVKTSRHHDAVGKTKAVFKWAVEDTEVLNQWNPRYQLKTATNIMSLQPYSWGWSLFAKIIRLIPKLAQGSKILTYQLH